MEQQLPAEVKGLFSQFFGKTAAEVAAQPQLMLPSGDGTSNTEPDEESDGCVV